jgi:hypothetical protein
LNVPGTWDVLFYSFYQGAGTKGRLNGFSGIFWRNVDRYIGLVPVRCHFSLFLSYLGGDEMTEKSAETPELASHHAPIGHEGLWHTPSKKVPVKQQLPALAYIQNIRNALMRSGHDEGSAHAIAVGAVTRWASGEGKVHPEVVAASQAALKEWEALRASHQ